MNARSIVGFGLACIVTAISFACGSSDSSGDIANGGDGSDGIGNGGDSGFIQTSSDGSSSTTQGDGAGCNAPVDMYIMFDRSGSMGADCNIGGNTNSKWCHAITALSGYFNSQGATDQAAALQFFPLDDQKDALCSTGDEYNVAAVPNTPSTPYLSLPTSAFDSILNSTKPGGGGGGNGGGTPTEAAIRGLTRFTAANRRGGRVTIGILVTDGDPNGCNESLTALSDLLAAHNQATQIRTYVIGMQGASFDNLEAIAAGGAAPMHADQVGAVTDACGNGAGPCRHWNVGDGNPAAFTAALAAIQDSANGCKDGGGYINPK